MIYSMPNAGCENAANEIHLHLISGPAIAQLASSEDEVIAMVEEGLSARGRRQVQSDDRNPLRPTNAYADGTKGWQ